MSSDRVVVWRSIPVVDVGVPMGVQEVADRHAEALLLARPPEDRLGGAPVAGIGAVDAGGSVVAPVSDGVVVETDAEFEGVGSVAPAA
jgi:hypothetical protein